MPHLPSRDACAATLILRLSCVAYSMEEVQLSNGMAWAKSKGSDKFDIFYFIDSAKQVSWPHHTVCSMCATLTGACTLRILRIRMHACYVY
jgi:hypothetical protein